MTNVDNYPSVIFVPESICDRGLLCGKVLVDDFLKTKNYFIHKVEEDLLNVSNNVIGVVGNIAIGRKRVKNPDWIRLKIQDELPLVVELLSDNILVKRGDYQLIIYNQTCFLQSDLLLDADCVDEASDNTINDHFKQLVYFLKCGEMRKTGNGIQPFIKLILVKFLNALKLVDKLLDELHFIMRFSTLAVYISTFMKNAVWCLELINLRKKNGKLKIGNYVFGLIADWLGGLIIIYWFMSLISITDVESLLSTRSEDVVLALKGMVRYLMGSPADLKLNSPLNNVLGKFFLFHIDLWWAFLGYLRPLLEVGLRLFVFLGSLGLSFQLAILADLLAVASFHVYVIYVYAARLYNAQLTGLASLSRVFLGRKRNPVPGRVDSCPYSTEQLLVGTIAFTVLLFLLPTTLVYYIVFTAIRVVLLAVGGLLARARFVLAVLPLYTSALWLIDSPTTTSCVRLTPERSGPGLVLRVRPAQDSWWSTVRRCLPEHVTPPPAPRWSELAWSLVTGRLVYPL